jgi:hypothetical protein
MSEYMRPERKIISKHELELVLGADKNHEKGALNKQTAHESNRCFEQTNTTRESNRCFARTTNTTH